MEFARYYKVTNKLNELIKESKVFSYTKDYYKDLFICEDTHVFWVCRVLEGYNEEYEMEKGMWLLERNRIDKYDFIKFLEENHKRKLKIENRRDRDDIINCLDTNFLIENIIIYDDKQGLENWDNCECDSYEDVVSLIDDGYGIIGGE